MNAHYLQQLPEEWEHKARIFAALGDGTRQKILLLFEAGETITLKTVVAVLPLSRSAVVHHITVLEQVGLLRACRQGREVGYTLNTAPLITSLEDVLDYARTISTPPCVALGAGTSTSVAAPVAAPVTAPVAAPMAAFSANTPHGNSGSTAGTRFAAEHKTINRHAKARFVPLSPQDLAHD